MVFLVHKKIDGDLRNTIIFSINFPQDMLNIFKKPKIKSFIWEGSQLGGTRRLELVNPFFSKMRFSNKKYGFWRFCLIKLTHVG